MAHFSHVDSNGVVTKVIVAEPDVIAAGEQGSPSEWIQTSYNTRGGVHYDPSTGEPSADQSKALRKNYAGAGMIYDAGRDAFYWPSPYPSWILNEDSCVWEPPTPAPGPQYRWDELTTSWVFNPDMK